MKNTKITSVILYILILSMAISLLWSVFGPGDEGLTYSQIVTLFKDEQVRKFTVQDQSIYM